MTRARVTNTRYHGIGDRFCQIRLYHPSPLSDRLDLSRPGSFWSLGSFLGWVLFEMIFPDYTELIYIFSFFSFSFFLDHLPYHQRIILNMFLTLADIL